MHIYFLRRIKKPFCAQFTWSNEQCKKTIFELQRKGKATYFLVEVECKVKKSYVYDLSIYLRTYIWEKVKVHKCTSLGIVFAFAEKSTCWVLNRWVSRSTIKVSALISVCYLNQIDLVSTTLQPSAVDEVVLSALSTDFAQCPLRFSSW